MRRRHIYLCANYSQWLRLFDVEAPILRSEGHQVDCRWIQGDHQMIQGLEPGVEMSAKYEVNQRIAHRDYHDLRCCDTLIYFYSPEGSNRGGRHVEFGIALERQMDIFIIGKLENVFHYLPGIQRFDCLVDALEALRS